MTHSETLFTARKDVANGILPPEIVTPRQLTKTIREIEKVLKQKYPNFEILVEKIFYYYSESKVHAVRLNETILIKVVFPLSSLDLRFNLYEVIQTRSPTFNGKHSSFIADLPKYVAVGSRRKYTINYQSRPEIIHDSIKLGNSKLEESSESCMIAIIENNSSKVHNYCKTVLFKEPVDTEIVRLTGSSMILANVERYTLYCSNGSWTHNITGCQFCTVQVPCDCNILTSKVLLPANLEDCTDSDKVRQQHLVDLNTLLHFFNESDLQTILGDTLLPHPINVTLPTFKLHDDKSRIEPDEEIKMNLKQAAYSIKSDRALFYTKQAEIARKLEDLDSLQEFNFSNLRDICIVVASGLILLLFALNSFLFYRNAKLAMIISAAGIVPGCKAENATQFPRFLVYSLSEVTKSQTLDNKSVQNFERFKFIRFPTKFRIPFIKNTNGAISLNNSTTHRNLY